MNPEYPCDNCRYRNSGCEEHLLSDAVCVIYELQTEINQLKASEPK